jgi:hypothetical protein
MARTPGKIPSALLILAGLAWLWACLWFPLTDTDIWWHLASAKLMWARKAFLREDPFCLASLGTPWTDLHWGFQCLGYAAWKLGGAPALVAGKCLAVAAALGFAFLPHLNRRTAFWLVPMAAFGLYHVRFFIDVRPLALTLLGLGIQYAVVMGTLRGRTRMPWLFLVPVQIAMVNIQGLYPLGAWLVTCLVLGEFLSRKLPARSGFATLPESGDADGRGPRSRPGLGPLAWTCVALWAAGLVSPYGLAGFTLPLALLGRITPVASNIFSSEIAENLPLSDLLRHHPMDALPFLLLGGLVLITFDRAKARTSPGHALLFLSFAALGWMAQRNLPLALLAGLMAAGRNLQVTQAYAAGAPSGAERGRGTPEGWAVAAGWGALALIALLYGGRIRAAWEYELPGSLETPFRFPAPAVDYLEAHPLPGNLFNELRYGGYLDFRLYPEKLAFIDGRMILRSGSFYRDFLDAVDHPERFSAFGERYSITHCVLPISEDRRFLPLAAYLARESGWPLLYCDGASVILADPDAYASAHPPVAPVPGALRSRFGANPRLEELAVGNAGAFLHAAGKDAEAAELDAAFPQHPSGR